MPDISKRAHTIGSLLALGVALLVPATANAGTYTVSGTCGLWQGYGSNGPYLTMYPACPELVVRNVGGPFSTPAGAEESRKGRVGQAQQCHRHHGCAETLACGRQAEEQVGRRLVGNGSLGLLAYA